MVINTDSLMPPQKEPTTDMRGIVVWGTRNVFCVVPVEEYRRCLEAKAPAVDLLRFASECRIKGKREKSEKEEEADSKNIQKHNTALVAGDEVMYSKIAGSFSGISKGVADGQTEDRTKNSHHSGGTMPQGLISRRAARSNIVSRDKDGTRFPLAVNIDLLCIVLSADNPPFRPRFADRLLWIAVMQNIRPLVIINKMDLLFPTENSENANLRVRADEIRARVAAFHAMGVETLLISAKGKPAPHAAGCYEDVSVLARAVASRRCAFVGQSGAGKSSIINALVPAARRLVGSISEKYNRGRHTTVRPEIVFGDGYSIVDTPGIRDLYPADITPSNAAQGFADIALYAPRCSMPGCMHKREPGCAVREALGQGLHPDRYESYVRLLEHAEQAEKTKWFRKKR